MKKFKKETRNEILKRIISKRIEKDVRMVFKPIRQISPNIKYNYQVSISSTLNARLFCTNVILAAFSTYM